MKKVLFTLMCIAAMLAAGTSLKAQEVTIVLNPGWTWISYPSTDTMDIATAFGSFTPEVGDIFKSKWGMTTYIGNGQWRGSLSPVFYPGYGYHYKSNRTTPILVTFNAQQPAPQMVATAMPTDITAVSAVVGGMVILPEGTHVFLRGVCWGTEPNPDIDGSHTTEGMGIGSFSNTLEGLNPSTTYYVCAYVVSDYGLAYGNVTSFTTLGGIPEVTTAAVTNILGDGATCGGTVVDGGGLAITARGVCWSTSHSPTLSNSHTTDGTGLGSFVSILTGFSANTTYYVRAYATTSQATSYGEEMTFTTMNGIPAVNTAEIVDITATTATCGGTVTTDGGLTITARGVCWGTSSNPTIADSHSTDGTGTGSFSSTLTGLTPNTTYYVRAYASNSLVTIYGGEQSFTTEAGGGGGGDHAYVDLGLPSGLLWATCNVGADNPEDYGDYFAWGETQPKDYYNWSTYQYCNGSYNTLTKYCTNSNYGYNGFVDNMTTLLPEDDAATANWGADWRMPTKEEWQELYNNTTVAWTTQNGVDGRLFTASNGNSLFLPAAGSRWDGELDTSGSYGNYWSSSLYTDYPNYAWDLSFDPGYTIVSDDYRRYGFSVRPVRSASQNTAPTGAINGKFTINADGDQVYFSQGNLQYQASTDSWRFAENQWDYVGTQTPDWQGYVYGTVGGSDNANISQNYNGWIDLFGWGTSGWNSGNTYYHPWDSNNSDGNLYGPPGQYDLTDLYANADWGVYNPISNGGNAANRWRTLTIQEWNYIFNTRSSTSGILYAKANVNNVNGVILLPDDWNSSIYILSNTNSNDASFNSNTISASQWNILEDAGAVFLPAGGTRNGTEVVVCGSHGIYWSASYRISSYSAYQLYFHDSLLEASSGSSRIFGSSVRLVQVLE